MEKWIVTAVDHGDSCDGKARVLSVCDNKEEASAYVRADIEHWADERAGVCIQVDFDGMYAVDEDSDTCCEWNIEKVAF